MPHRELLQTLRALLGPSHVLVDGDLSAYELDWRGRERGKALAVVRPGSTQEVAAVVKACAAAGVSMVPQGGNTGMVVGSTPDASGEQVVISLGRMNAVRKLEDEFGITALFFCGLSFPSAAFAARALHPFASKCAMSRLWHSRSQYVAPQPVHSSGFFAPSSPSTPSSPCTTSTPSAV
jgi:hypothetical protein